MTNVMAIAVCGMQSAQRAFGAAATNVVAAGLPAATAISPATSRPLNAPAPLAGDLAAPMIGALQAANSFRASLALFRAGERMIKTTIDTLA
jgi:hypothetical protein